MNDKQQQLQQNLAITQKKIVQFSPPLSRPPLLLAVSKKQSIEAIEQIYNCGVRDFAESFVQESMDKIPQLPPDIRWHYIGRIQSNKLKKIAQYFHWVHTLSELRHAQKLQWYCQELSKQMQVCLQINVDMEPQKSGISIAQIDQIDALVDYVGNCPNLVLRGLMCMLQESEDYPQQIASFTRLASLKETLNQKFKLNMDQLSMGMSADMKAAIVAGSTIIRVGSAIFGQQE